MARRLCVSRSLQKTPVSPGPSSLTQHVLSENTVTGLTNTFDEALSVSAAEVCMVQPRNAKHEGLFSFSDLSLSTLQEARSFPPKPPKNFLRKINNFSLEESTRVADNQWSWCPKMRAFRTQCRGPRTVAFVPGLKALGWRQQW